MSETLVLQYVGLVQGVKAYAPIDAMAVKLIGSNEFIVCEMVKKTSLRTKLQNRAIHLYFTWLCEALNNAGLDMVLVMAKLSKTAKIPWSPLAVKEKLWAPTQMHSFGHKSTTKLETHQVTTVFEALNQVTGECLGVSINFPDYRHQMEEQLIDQYDKEQGNH